MFKPTHCTRGRAMLKPTRCRQRPEACVHQSMFKYAQGFVGRVRDRRLHDAAGMVDTVRLLPLSFKYYVWDMP